MKDQNQNARDEQMFAYASWMSKHGGFAKDMTLRDHFAAMALQVLIANDETSLREDAKDAYMVADAMLKARGQAMKAALLSLALLCGSVHAEFYTGNDLLQRLNSDILAERSAAIGYIMGVADSGHGVSYCPPEAVTSGQMRDMVRNYLTNTPAVRHLAADSLVTHVIKSSWPCAARPPGRSL